MKKNFFSQMWDMIIKSSYNSTGKVSSSRISSYFILGSILTSSLVFIVIEIGNAVFSWMKKEVYVIPTEHIAIFGMILSHHLLLLGIVKNAKSEPQAIYVDSLAKIQSTSNNKEEQGKNKENTNTSEKNQEEIIDTGNMGDLEKP